MAGGVVAFESSSLNKLAQSLIGHPSAPVRISVLSRGARFLLDHDVELTFHAAGVSQSPRQRAFAHGFEVRIECLSAEVRWKLARLQRENHNLKIMQYTIPLA